MEAGGGGMGGDGVGVGEPGTSKGNYRRRSD